jgi:hypothetical protein
LTKACRKLADAFIVCKIAGRSSSGLLLMRLQLLGGRGYIESNPATANLRDARLLRIFEGPPETLNMFLGSSILHGQQLDEFMKVELGSANVAAILRSTVTQIDSRASEFTVVQLRHGQLSLIAHLVGQTGTWAPVAVHAGATTKQTRRAVQWAQRSFKQMRNRALNEATAASMVLSTSATTETIEVTPRRSAISNRPEREDHEMDLLKVARAVAKTPGLKRFKEDREVTTQKAMACGR